MALRALGILPPAILVGHDRSLEFALRVLPLVIAHVHQRLPEFPLAVDLLADHKVEDNHSHEGEEEHESENQVVDKRIFGVFDQIAGRTLRPRDVADPRVYLHRPVNNSSRPRDHQGDKAHPQHVLPRPALGHGRPVGCADEPVAVKGHRGQHDARGHVREGGAGAQGPAQAVAVVVEGVSQVQHLPGHRHQAADKVKGPKGHDGRP